MSLILRIQLSIILLFPILSNAQEDSIAQAYISAAKAEFSKPFAEQNYVQALALTAKAIELDPNNPEAHYVLGNVYDKINAKDASSLLSISPKLTELSAQSLAKCLQLDPDFEKTLVLSPREKIFSVYASLALKYHVEGKPDSLKVAFKKADELLADEFLMRDFLEFFLNTCKPNAFVFSSGDLISYNLLYLLEYKGIRKDITFVDINLLNTKWYPEYFRSNKIINFQIDSLALDSISYTLWPINEITVANFSWDVYPSYSKYLLRGDLVFKEILEANAWEKEIYFTAGISENSGLSLIKIGEPIMFGNYFHPSKNSGLNSLKLIKSYAKIIDQHFYLSKEDLKAISMLRFYVLLEINRLVEDKKFKEASKLLKKLEKQISIEDYPYLHQSTSMFRDQLKLSIKNEGTAD